MSRQPLRIAFAGASGTGKTTLAKYVYEVMAPDMKFNPIGSRSVSKMMGFNSPYDVDMASLLVYNQTLNRTRDANKAARKSMEGCTLGDTTMRAKFQQVLMLEKVAWEENHPFMVTDRTTLDVAAYIAMHCPNELHTGILDVAVKHMALYDIIFYCPMEPFIRLDDGVRVTTLGYHKAYDFFIHGGLKKCTDGESHTELIALQTPDLDKRKEIVHKTVTRWVEWLKSKN